MTEATSDKRGNRKTRAGIVLSNRQSKTIVVEVERKMIHPLYRKVLTRKKRYYAHDEKNEAKVGDRVEITETRPLSKLKRWSLEEIVRRSSLGQLEDTAIDAGTGVVN